MVSELELRPLEPEKDIEMEVEADKEPKTVTELEKEPEKGLEKEPEEKESEEKEPEKKEPEEKEPEEKEPEKKEPEKKEPEKKEPEKKEPEKELEKEPEKTEPEKEVKKEPEEQPKKESEKETGTKRKALDELPGHDGRIPKKVARMEQQDPEARPALGSYKPEFSKAEQHCHSIADRLIKLFQESPYKDQDTEGYLNTAHQLRTINYPGLVSVGFVGNAGQGKSSVINSLLRQDSLAEEGSGGASCTSVVQEYVSTLEEQATPFRTDIFYFTGQEASSFLRICFKIAYDYLSKRKSTLDSGNESEEKEEDDDDEDNDNDNDDDQDEEDSEDAASDTRFQNCLKCLVALFRDQRAFKDTTAAKKTIKAAQSAHDPNILKKINSWLIDLGEKLNEVNGVTTVSANSLDELRDRVAPYTRDLQEGEIDHLGFSPWPIVRFTRTGLEAALLESGVTLVDLPGLSDINHRRVEITKQYIKQCQVTCVVNEVSRVTSLPVVHQYLKDANRRRRGPYTLLVCTKSDLIDSTLSKSSRQSLAANGPASLSKQLELYIKEKRSLELRWQELDAALTNAASLEDMAQVNIGRTELRNKLEKNKGHIEATKAEAKRQAIKEQERQVVASMQETWRTVVRSRQALPVFCVSNLEYSLHLSTTGTSKAPRLSITDTGIPALRAHLYGLPSKGKIDSLSHHFRNRIPHFLAALRQTSSTTKVQRREDLFHTFEMEMHKALTEKIGEMFDGVIKEDLQVTFMNEIKAHEKKWITHGRKCCQEWAGWQAASYRAFLRHNGHWGTKKIKDQNWNEKLLEKVAGLLETDFNGILSACAGAVRVSFFETVVEPVLNAIKDLVRNESAGVQRSLQAFIDSLAYKRGELEKVAIDEAVNLESKLSEIESRANTISEESYFNKAMVPIYTQTLKFKARVKVHNKRAREFEKKVCNARSGPYVKIRHGIKTDIEMELNITQKRLMSELTKVFEAIKKEFRTNFSTEESKEPGAVALRQKISEIIPELTKTLNDEIPILVQKCQAADKDEMVIKEEK